MKNEDTRVQYTRSALKHAAASLLKEKPIAKITVKELCEKAGINRGTFYLHYGSPDEVLREMQKDFLETNRADFQAYMESPQSAHSQNFISTLLDCIDRDRELTRAVFSRNGNPYFIDNIKSLSKEQTQKEWKQEYPAASQEALDFVYDYVFEGSMYMIQKWINGDIDCTGTQMSARLDHLGTHCLHSLMEF